MDFKKFWKETFAGFVLKNMLIAFGIIIILCWITLIAIDYHTAHGDSEQVPDLRGLYVEEAEILLAKKGLFPKVIDSVYIRGKLLGTIVDQIPGVHASVKRNRAIFLIVNSKQVRQVALPELEDVSYRQAEAMLQSIGLKIEQIIYTPSEYKDLVSEVKFRGNTVLPGTRLPEGSSVILVVGSGLGDYAMMVPSLHGLKLETARERVLNDSLVIGSIDYDITPTTTNKNNYFVYRQKPAEGEYLQAGSRVDIWLTTDKNRLEETGEPQEKKKTQKKEADEVFF